MERTVEAIRGDTPGVSWSLTVLRFKGSTPGAPSAYLQAALHGNELPGVAALHYLIPRLVAAEAEGRIAGDITIVPHANPIGSGQFHFGVQAGRFALGTRVNFNRDFPIPATLDTGHLPGDDAPIFAEKRLKALLVRLAIGHDLVLDLHCDDQGLSYLYVPTPFWPHMADLAGALGSEAVILWHESSDGAFEEAAFGPHRSRPAEDPAFARCAATTVEFRGLADVSPAQAQADADGLYRFLAGRGTIREDTGAAIRPFSGIAAPIAHVEMVRAPAGGTILYHATPGDRVEAGQLLAEIVTAPGESAVPVTAPQAGVVLTRRAHRFTRIGDDLLKVIGFRPSAGATEGTLED